MATYLVLESFTDQGMRAVKDTTKRAETIRGMGKKMGVTVKDIYWLLGQYDVMILADAPDDATATAFVASIASAGNVRCHTLRAFSQDEVVKILDKIT